MPTAVALVLEPRMQSRRCGVFLSYVLFVFFGAVQAGGGGVACSSAVVGEECSPTQPSHPSCAADSSDDCSRNAGDPAAFYNPNYVDHPLVRECQSYPSTSASPTHAVARDLTVILYPVGRDKKYSLYVSWQTSSLDANTQGFYIWSYKCSGACPFHNDTAPPYNNLPFYDRGRYECLPVHNAHAKSVLFNGAEHRTGLLQCKDGRHYSPPRCNSPAIMTVVVIPRPRSAEVTFFDLLESSSVTVAWRNLDRCWATAYSNNCSSPVLIRPVDDFNTTTTALPDGLMNIHVTWLPYPGDVEYIVTVTDPLITVTPNCTSPGHNPPCFVARGTTQVTISMLSLHKEYSVSVQVVPKCNGSSFAEHYVGCRSEECCQAKRISHVTSGDPSPSPVDSNSAYLVPTGSSTGAPLKRHSSGINVGISTESSHGSIKSSRVSRVSSRDTMNTDGETWTKDVQPTTTAHNPDSPEEKTESSHVSIKSSRVSRVSSRDTMNTDGETWTKDVQPTTTAHNPDSPEEKTESSHVSIKSSRVSRVSSRDTMNTDGETWTKDVQPTTTAHNPDSPEEKTESSHVSIKSSRVSRVSSRDTMNTDGETWTKDVQPTTTAHNPDSPEEKTGVDNSSGTVIGVAVSLAFVVALFIVCAVSIIVFYFARKKGKTAASSLTSASSLAESFEESCAERTSDTRGQYCNMMTIDHVVEPTSYAVTSSGVAVTKDAPLISLSSSVALSSLDKGQESETTFETESFTEGSPSVDVEKFSSGISSLEDDAFEKAVDKFGEGVPINSNINDSIVPNDSKANDGVTGRRQQEKTQQERWNRSESVRIKTRRTGSSSSSSKRRPRSFSTPNNTRKDFHRPPSALILYSKNSPPDEQRVIQQCLVSDLTQYNIRTVSEDTCCSRKCPASWLEVQMREASAVFCVCNEAFDSEWENKTDRSLSSLVPVFKQLCHGLITPSCGRNQLMRDKIAIVLLCEGDLRYVPTYINSRPKFHPLMQGGLESCARFVIGMPKYTTHSTDHY